MSIKDECPLFFVIFLFCSKTALHPIRYIAKYLWQSCLWWNDQEPLNVPSMGYPKITSKKSGFSVKQRVKELTLPLQIMRLPRDITKCQRQRWEGHASGSTPLPTLLPRPVLLTQGIKQECLLLRDSRTASPVLSMGRGCHHFYLFIFW